METGTSYWPEVTITITARMCYSTGWQHIISRKSWA